jgi:hypothetical protein
MSEDLVNMGTNNLFKKNKNHISEFQNGLKQNIRMLQTIYPTNMQKIKFKYFVFCFTQKWQTWEDFLCASYIRARTTLLRVPSLNKNTSF